MFDSGAFSDILKAYCKKAMQNCKIDDDTIDRVMREIKWLLDTEKATGDVKAVMNVDAAMIPDRKALEINVGINNTIIFLHEMGIEYCPKCGREL